LQRVILAAVAATIAVLAFASSASATCYYSNASSQSYADSPADGDLGLAPEITGVRADSDGACGLSVEPVVTNPYGGDLIDGEAVATYLNIDGNPSTGSPVWNGADRVVITVGLTGPDYAPGVGTWNGSTFDFVGGASLPRVGIGGWKANVDQLGIASPVNLSFRTGAIYEGIYDVYGDFAPEPNAASFVFPLSISTVAPPPPSPPAPPAQTQTQTPAPSSSGPVRNPQSQSEDSEACRVPAVKRKTASSAARAMRRAGCFYGITRVYSSVRAGRVISTSPRAGRSTDDMVSVKVSRGRRPKRRGKIALDALATVERKLSAHQEALQP
jgi:hypothetical protein